MPQVTLTVNGKQHTAEVEGRTLLVELLREKLGLTGTHVGCDTSQCGACVVHINGDSVKSCTILALQADGAQVTTIEAIAQDPVGKRVVDAWVAGDVAQCGYCQSGQVVAATALLKATPKPTDAEFAAAMTNLCRCGTYLDIAGAVKALIGRIERENPAALDDGSLYDRVIGEVERPLIELMLARHGQNQLRAARAMGINRNTLRKRLDTLGIDISGDMTELDAAGLR